MNGRAYYNEIDPFAAQWLRNLIAAGLIAPGDVDERSIVDVRPSDLAGYSQCHFFAGIGVWSYSLRKAGWPDDRPIWTGSCPCQPFSAAGKGGGFDDERHLWPAFFHLIEQCRPAVVLGEQVASKDGLAWLDLVQTDMEGADYAIGAVDTCSASVGAPHIRQRLRFAAKRLDNSTSARRFRPEQIPETDSWNEARLRLPGARGGPRQLADADSQDCRWRGVQGSGEGSGARAGTARERPPGFCETDAGRPGPTNGFWRDADWLFCRDGKWRPVEPGTFPLVDGAPSRVGRLRAYGNAVDAEATREFCEAVIGSIGDCLT